MLSMCVLEMLDSSRLYTVSLITPTTLVVFSCCSFVEAVQPSTIIVNTLLPCLLTPVGITFDILPQDDVIMSTPDV